MSQLIWPISKNQLQFAFTNIGRKLPQIDIIVTMLRNRFSPFVRNYFYLVWDLISFIFFCIFTLHEINCQYKRFKLYTLLLGLYFHNIEVLRVMRNLQDCTYITVSGEYQCSIHFNIILIIPTTNLRTISTLTINITTNKRS